FNTTAGNPVKKILLKLNLSDHRLSKMVVEVPDSSWLTRSITTCSYPIDKHKCQSVKVKEFQERCNIKAFQEWYEHVGPEVASPQDGKVTRWRRDCAWLMISRCSRSQCQIQVQGTSSIQEVNDHYNIFTRESQEYELKTKDKAYLKRRVKKLEQKKRSRTHGLKRLRKVGATARVESSGDKASLGEDASKQGKINAIDADDDITLVSVQNVDEEMFDVDALNGEEVFVAEQNENVVEVVDAAQVSTAATTITITTEEITLAQALEALKTSKPKVKGIVFQEPGESTTTKSTPTISSQQSQDKGKGIMIEEPVKPIKKKDLIRLDEEVALKLQAKFDEEERLAREKFEKEKEANIALIEE
ncbi:hypothetical protein Tco_0005049, partial [Tanacetum coccineum]